MAGQKECHTPNLQDLGSPLLDLSNEVLLVFALFLVLSEIDRIRNQYLRCVIARARICIFLYIYIFAYLLPVCNERRACWSIRLNYITCIDVLSTKKDKKVEKWNTIHISIFLPICHYIVMKDNLVGLVGSIVSFIWVFWAVKSVKK